MFTYLILNCVFLIASYILLRIPLRRPNRVLLYTCLCLLIMTAVFDSLIIAADIVNYNPSKLLGIFIFLAPAEDFFYSLLAVSIIPFLWKRNSSHDANA